MAGRTSSLVAMLAGLLVPLAGGCTQGDPEPGTTALSGAFTVGPADTEATDGSGGTTADADATEGGSGGQDATGGSDDGDLSCCTVAATPGCGSPQTESCVCTAQPACCQQVWSAECVDLAEQCGDPSCTAATGEPSDDTGDPPPPLECDAAFGFAPQNPAPGVAFDVTFTDPVGLTWVGLHADGPGGASIEGSYDGVTGSGPFTWTYGYSGLAAGVWTFAFTHRETENGPVLVRASCAKQF